MEGLRLLVQCVPVVLLVAVVVDELCRYRPRSLRVVLALGLVAAVTGWVASAPGISLSPDFVWPSGLAAGVVAGLLWRPLRSRA